jgi:hypothetical protein
MNQADTIAGFYAPVHRALTEPILLGGAPPGGRDRQRHARGCSGSGAARQKA